MKTISYDTNNIFAKILRNEIPCTKVYEDEFSLAFYDIDPAAPIHVLVIPKTPHVSFDDFCNNATQNEIHGFFSAITKTIAILGLNRKNGYRLITNCGPDALQTVEHFHVHILAGKQLGLLLSDDNQ